jgi:hypothetical protein
VRSRPSIEESDLCRIAQLLAGLTPAQQRVVAILADGLRAGWVDPASWQRSWRRCDLNDDGVLGQARTWLVRRAGVVGDTLHGWVD